MKLCVALAALLALSACRCAASPPPPPPVPFGADAGDLCDLAWRRLEQLSCPEATSPKGVTFSTTCHDVEDAGVNLHPECVMNVADCSQVGRASRGEVGCP